MTQKTKNVLHNLRQTVCISFVLLLVCGLLYPLLMTGLSSLIFPYQAGGSLLTVEGTPVAAAHVGQEFTEDYFLWSRPSAYHYNVYTEDGTGERSYRDGTPFPGAGSGSANLAPSNPKLTERVEADMAEFLARNPDVRAAEIPTDLLTSSGSGLDPHISPASAEIQVPRIAAASGLSEGQVREFITAHTSGKLLGVFGEETVNVVEVNIEIAAAMEHNAAD